jgi:hypothetical protein
VSITLGRIPTIPIDGRVTSTLPNFRSFTRDADLLLTYPRARNQVQRASGVERMVSMTIRIPDDLARGLEGIAAAQKKSVEQVALERLRSLLDQTTSPQAVLRTLRQLPHPSSSAVDDLDASIAASRLPVRDGGAFDRWPKG